MRPRPPNAMLEQLLALRDAQAQLARHVLRTHGGPLTNEPVRQALMDAAKVAADHARRLDPLLTRWSRNEAADEYLEEAPPVENAARDLVESWLAVTEDARDLYEHAAAQAPAHAAGELRKLAVEKARVVERLRGLL